MMKRLLIAYTVNADLEKTSLDTMAAAIGQAAAAVSSYAPRRAQHARQLRRR